MGLILLQTFSGTQNVSGLQKDEAWRVNVCVQGCDLEHGYLCGTMEALNVPMADTPVRHLFSSCIVLCNCLSGVFSLSSFISFISLFLLDMLGLNLLYKTCKHAQVHMHMKVQRICFFM